MKMKSTELCKITRKALGTYYLYRTVVTVCCNDTRLRTKLGLQEEEQSSRKSLYGASVEPIIFHFWTHVFFTRYNIRQFHVSWRYTVPVSILGTVWFIHFTSFCQSGADTFVCLFVCFAFGPDSFPSIWPQTWGLGDKKKLPCNIT